MKKTQFAKLYDLVIAQVLVIKTIDEYAQLPAIKVSTFDADGLEFKTIYSFGTQIIRDQSFDLYSQKHAVEFLQTANSLVNNLGHKSDF